MATISLAPLEVTAYNTHQAHTVFKHIWQQLLLSMIKIPENPTDSTLGIKPPLSMIEKLRTPTDNTFASSCRRF